MIALEILRNRHSPAGHFYFLTYTLWGYIISVNERYNDDIKNLARTAVPPWFCIRADRMENNK